MGKQKLGHLVDKVRLQEVERNVSACIQSSFTFTLFEVPTADERLRIESRLISTLSLCHTVSKNYPRAFASHRT
jgi:hypothetical protein